MWQAEIRVDLDAIRHNVGLLRAGTTAEVMAVVKADGYGHGMVPVARAALDAGATWLGACTLDEALALRAAGITAPVLAWLLVPGLPLHRGVEAGVDLSASGTGLLAELVAAARVGLRPAMTVRARVLLAKRVAAGEGVSYGHTYTTGAQTTLAVVPLGYGDGVPRHASNSGPVWLAGRRRTIAGRVCMDQIVLDCGDDPVAAGDVAVLFGPGDEGEPTADDWAAAVGTINYEIVTRMSTVRVPRVYAGG